MGIATVARIMRRHGRWCGPRAMWDAVLRLLYAATKAENRAVSAMPEYLIGLEETEANGLPRLVEVLRDEGSTPLGTLCGTSPASTAATPYCLEEQGYRRAVEEELRGDREDGEGSVGGLHQGHERQVEETTGISLEG